MEAKSNEESRAEEEHEAHTAEETGRLDESVYDSDGLSAMDRQYATQPDLPKQIHILGATGNIGKLVAHSLKGLPNPPPITLILHRYRLVEAWHQSKGKITLQDDGHEVVRDGFDVELMPERRFQHKLEVGLGAGPYDMEGEMRPDEAAQVIKQQREEAGETVPGLYQPSRERPGDKYVSEEPIHNLIVAVKAARTLAALRTIAHRLLPTSTICFLQNGMGMIDDVNKEIFPEEETRPNYMQGIVTHGANVPPAKAEEDPFYVVHAGHGTIALGLLPRPDLKASSDDGNESKSKWPASSRYLLRTLTRSPVLCAVGFTPTELLQQQLEKLAVNSVINPLTALLDNRNGSLLYNFALTRTQRLMIAETSHVIRSLPELRGIPNVNVRFSPERLENIVVSIAEKTKDNISSMLADVRAGRRTEIEYINGYIVRRGEELGIKCVVNYAMMQTVIGKQAMIMREGREDVPRERQMFLE